MDTKNALYKIVYFSGTGGTALAAACFEDILKNEGCRVSSYRIGRDTDRDLSEGHDFLLLLFPVHAFNAPEPVYRWIEKQPAVRGKKAAVISVSGGGEMFPNKASRLSSIRMLEKKGYRVVYESMLVMPPNCMTPVKPIVAKMLLDVLPEKVRDIVKELLEGKIVRSRLSTADRIASRLGEMEKPSAKIWGRCIQSTDACTSCGWCSANCPAGNIKMSNGKPRFGRKCSMCLGCIYGCPEQALIPGIGKFMVLKEGYDINKMQLPAPSGRLEKSKTAVLKTIKKEAKGIWWLGLRKYLSGR